MLKQVNNKYLDFLYASFQSAADPEAMLKFIRAGWERLRRQSAEHDLAHRDAVFERLLELGMSECWKGDVPADGVTSFGGWIMPQRFRVERGSIQAVSGSCSGLLLFDYTLNPAALMLRSGGTQGKVIAPLIALEGEPAEEHRGCIALLRRPELELIRRCFRAGIIGVLSDTKPHRPEVQDGPELDEATAWLNYSLPPWREERGFGVAITPRDGTLLRESLSEGPVAIEAEIEARPAESTVPVISAVWPEGRDEEIVLTGHIDEVGADDNLSGIAASIEVVRCYKQLVSENKLPAPRRGIRLLFGPEVYGLQSFIADDSLPWRRFRAGLNLDTVGSEQEKVNAWLKHGETFPTSPHCADTLIEEILSLLREKHPRFRYSQEGVDVIDNGIADPEIGAPTPQLYHFTAHHHTNLDRPEFIDPVMLSRAVGIAGAYCAVFANPSADSASWLARRAYARGLAATASAVMDGRDASSLQRKHRRRLATTADLLPPESLSSLVSSYRSPGEAIEKHSAYAPLQHKRLIKALDSEMESATERAYRLLGIVRQEDALRQPSGAEFLCYRKRFRGLLGTESLLGSGHEKLRAAGYRPYWGAPLWLIMACFLCDGTRSVAEVEWELELLGYQMAGKKLDEILGILAEGGLLESRPVITEQNILDALQSSGVSHGDVLFAQFSDGALGCVKGSRQAELSALRRAIGETGTLIMPAFSYSCLGEEPFDRASSLSKAGALSELFRKSAGAARSRHPTHSFCAEGRLAGEIIARHDASEAPLSTEGPVGKLLEAGAKVALLGDFSCCLPFLAGESVKETAEPAYSVVARKGGGEELVEVRTAPEAGDFQQVADSLRKKNLIRSEQLGLGTLFTFSFSDAFEAAANG